MQCGRCASPDAGGGGWGHAGGSSSVGVVAAGVETKPVAVAGLVAVTESMPVRRRGRGVCAVGSVCGSFLCLCLVLLWHFPFLSQQVWLELQLPISWEGEVDGMGVSWWRRLPSAGRAGSGLVDIEIGILLGGCLGHVGLE
jgi:hypothetical protein